MTASFLAVESTLTSTVGYLTATIGEQATFGCVVEGNFTYKILWKIEMMEFDCYEVSEVTNCFPSNNIRHFQITDTSFLGIGTHEVQCILQPIIDSNYQEDPSFKPHLYNENITRTAAFLTIVGRNTSKCRQDSHNYGWKWL